MLLMGYFFRGLTLKCRLIEYLWYQIEVSHDDQLMTTIFHVTVFINGVIGLKKNPKSKKESIE